MIPYSFLLLLAIPIAIGDNFLKYTKWYSDERPSNVKDGTRRSLTLPHEPPANLFNTTENPHPWAVYISYNERTVCSGSIIHQQWVLTAARCYQDDYWGVAPVVVSGTKHYGNNRYYGYVYEVDYFTVHPDYKQRPQTKDVPYEYAVNDIALIRTIQLIAWNPRVSKITLAADTYEFLADRQTVSISWGMLNYFYPSDELMVNYLRIIKHKTCKEAWPYIDNTYLCTETAIEQSDMCESDSGAPLVLYDGIQVGVFSTSALKCDASKPDLFTKVSEFIPWIKIQMWKKREFLYS